MSRDKTNRSPRTRVREQSSSPSAVRTFPRPGVRGKFLYVGDEKLWVRGVTYGTFRPAADGTEYPNPEVVEQDFAQVAANGFNAIRTYSTPPRWLLDAAQRYDLRVMVGLSWEQHIAFLEDRARARAIERRIRESMQACSDHPAILCYAIGNEIPAAIVRWYGHPRVEGYLERLYQAAKSEDPNGIFTYVNYPTTEYLQLPFIDLVCFNVYLEAQERFEAYLGRLQNIAGNRPLIMTEIGLDSRRHREEGQARALDWQIRTTFAAGCAGAFVFAWTDQWHRGGYDIDDWDFGLTRRDRRLKPALAAVRQAFAQVPFPPETPWPRIAVVVCTHNGERPIGDCLRGLMQLEYPNFEVIVVDDGSTDATAAIVKKHDVRLISIRSSGLAIARNTGMEAATGEIVAYIDDDAWPDPHWLTYLAATFLRSAHAGVGGPNIPPPGEGSIADCVTNAPGGPIHVLLSDHEAEHIPGCNMAFRKACLQAIGGFDPQFRVAGDDVDVCWRLRQRGWTLGFSHAAVVWHRRRGSLRAYWKQQKGYGEAEALLQKKWPEKYNAAGHLSWSGRVYGNGLTHALGWPRGRIYEGTWGSALFKSLYQPAPSVLWALPLMPEWYLIIVALAALFALGIFWTPLFLTLPLLTAAVGALLVQAYVSAARASFTTPAPTRFSRLKLRSMTAFLHLVQPLARLWGRQRLGLTPWRRRGIRGFAFPRPRTFAIWSEHWQASTARLRSLEAVLLAQRIVVLRGGEYESWDLEIRDGTFGAVRMRMATEEHGAGTQLVRLRAWPRVSSGSLALILLPGVLCVLAAVGHAWTASAIFAGTALLLTIRTVQDCAVAMAVVLSSVRQWQAWPVPAEPEASGRIGLGDATFKTVASLKRRRGAWRGTGFALDQEEGEETP